ncbi:MAG TPA: hypothetical protein PK638_05450 [Candidatus Enterocola sp.]|nr:hypothetical protein [Candidatus Enterocola sp.]
MKTNYYSSSWFKKPIFSSSWQKCMVLAIFLLMSVLSVFADQVLPVYHSPYSSSRLYKTREYLVKRNLPVFTAQPLPVYRSSHRIVREYHSPTFSVTVQDNYSSSSYNYSSTSGFTITDYTQRKPFEETDISMLSSQNRSMRAPAEDDPPFPGDPGQMPVGDGLGFLLLAAAGYALMKRKSFNK